MATCELGLAYRYRMHEGFHPDFLRKAIRGKFEIQGEQAVYQSAACFPKKFSVLGCLRLHLMHSQAIL